MGSFSCPPTPELVEARILGQLRKMNYVFGGAAVDFET
jgi:hypothetical protein